jgi:hypothetical protein
MGTMRSTDHLNRQMHCRTALFPASPPGRETENVTGRKEEQVAAYGKTVAVGSDVLKGLNAVTTAAGVAAAATSPTSADGVTVQKAIVAGLQVSTGAEKQLVKATTAETEQQNLQQQQEERKQKQAQENQTNITEYQ